jgi:hypothetical protein
MTAGSKVRWGRKRLDLLFYSLDESCPAGKILAKKRGAEAQEKLPGAILPGVGQASRDKRDPRFSIPLSQFDQMRKAGLKWEKGLVCLSGPRMWVDQGIGLREDHQHLSLMQQFERERDCPAQVAPGLAGLIGARARSR